ncbi:MAG: nickel pincer cofactor biosynthesis protein LarC [candidate division WOR-3 bacterium]
MRVLLFDPIPGASGDMILSALIDLGVDPRYLEKIILKTGFKRFRIIVQDVRRQTIRAKLVKFDFDTTIAAENFLPVIKKSNLTEFVKINSIKTIKRIFETESRVHKRRNPHLHELADLDTFIDIVCSFAGIEFLKVDKIYSRPLKAGFIDTAHGRMPAFNLATAELLKDRAVEFLPIDFELTTPTGAAIISSIAEPINNLPIEKILSIGYGAGTRELEGYPNIMRIFLGEMASSQPDAVTLLETNLDYQNPQIYDYIYDRLFEAGALDVYLIPTIQKKSRPGVLLNVICRRSAVEELLRIIFSETTSLGVRIVNLDRRILPREIKRIKTPLGMMRYKIAHIDQRPKISLEYEDLKKIARKSKQPLIDVQNIVLKYLTKGLKK